MAVPFVPLASLPSSAGISSGSLSPTIIPAAQQDPNRGIWTRALVNFLGNAASSATDYGLKEAFKPEYSGEQLNQMFGTALDPNQDFAEPLVGPLAEGARQKVALAEAGKMAGEKQAFDLNLEDIGNRDAILRQEALLAGTASEGEKDRAAKAELEDRTRRYGAKVNMAKFLGDQNQSDYNQLVDMFNNPYLSPEERAAIMPHIDRTRALSDKLQQFYGAGAVGDPNAENRFLTEFQNIPAIQSAPNLSPRDIFIRRAGTMGVSPDQAGRIYDVKFGSGNAGAVSPKIDSTRDTIIPSSWGEGLYNLLTTGGEGSPLYKFFTENPIGPTAAPIF